jgi:ferredoxin
MVEVLQGAENLSSPSALETDLLKNKFARSGYRLACQAMVLGDVSIKPA